MRCCAAQKRLTPLLLGELEHSDADQVLAHVRVCQQCRREMDALGLTVDLMRELPPMPFPSEIDARLAERIGAEERRSWSGLLWSWQARTVAAVAVAAVLVGLAVFASRPREAEAAPSTIILAEGSPRILQHGEEPQYAERDLVVTGSQQVQTDDGARVLLRLPDGSQARVDYNSMVEVRPQRTLWTKTAAYRLKVHAGRAWVWSPGDGDGVHVEFSDYSASVRAAEVLVDAGDQREASGVRFVTLGGQAVVEGRGARTAVPPTVEMWVGEDGPPQYSSDAARIGMLRVQSRLGRHYMVFPPPPVRRVDLLGLLAAQRAYLGIDVAPVPAPGGGLTVDDVSPGSSADAAGIRKNDVLVSIDGRALTVAVDIAAQEVLLADQDRATVVMRREGLRMRRELLLKTTLDPNIPWSSQHATSLNLAARLVAEDDIPGAEALYQSIAADGGECTAALLNLTLLAQHERRWRDAVSLCAQAASLAPTKAEIRLAYGHALLGIGNVRRAVEELRQASALDPDLARARYLLGLSLAFDGRQEDCEQQAQRLMDGNERADLAALLRGLAAGLLGDHTAARDHFQAVLADDPHNLIARRRLASSHLALGQLTEAEAEVKKALDQAPDYFEAANTLGLVFTKRVKPIQGWLRKRDLESAPVFGKTRRKDFIAAGLQDLIGADEDTLRAAVEENLREAEYWLHHALRLQPESAETLTNLGSVAMKRDDLPGAELLYAKAITIDPDLAPVRFGFGRLLERQERYAEAETQYELALQLDPTDSDARNCLVELWKDRGRLAAARQAELHYWL